MVDYGKGAVESEIEGTESGNRTSASFGQKLGRRVFHVASSQSEIADLGMHVLVQLLRGK